MNTFEYIWLDGYQPEPMMRSKVKPLRMILHQIGLLMGLQLNKQKVAVLTAYFYQSRLMLIQMVMTWL